MPETHRPIELLEPKKIITSSDEITVITQVIDYNFIHDENISPQYSIGTEDVFPSIGRIVGGIEVNAYLETENHIAITDQMNVVSNLSKEAMSMRKIIFDIPELRGKLFILSSYEINSAPMEFAYVKITANQISSNGVLV